MDSTSDERQRLFARIAKIRDDLKPAEKPAKAPSENTVGEYQRIWNLLQLRGQGKIPGMLQAARNTTSPRTWFKRRAAMLYMLHRYCDLSLARQQEVQRQEGYSAQWIADVNKLEKGYQVLLDVRTSEAIPLEGRAPRRTKKRSISRLPEDWREQVIDGVPENWRLQVLVLAATGCRPAELGKGVRIRLGGGKLTFLIQGAKLTHDAGQKLRRISIYLPTDHPIYSALCKALGGMEGSWTVDLDRRKPVSLTMAIKRAADKLWPRRKNQVTAYSFRHQIAADFKELFGEGEETSIALGHASDKTRTFYGSRNQAGGSAVRMEVEGSREVKHKKKTNPRRPRQSRTGLGIR